MERLGVAVGVLSASLSLVSLGVPDIPEHVRLILFWVGIAGLVVAAIIGFWNTRLVRRVRSALGFDETQGRIRMDDAARYIHQESVWAKRHEQDAKWFITIENDIKDALRLGEVRAWGRPSLGNALPTSSLKDPLEPIPVEHWSIYRPAIFDGLQGNRTSNHSARAMASDGRHYGFYDIEFSISDLRRQWPRMGWFAKRRHTPLRLRTS